MIRNFLTPSHQYSTPMYNRYLYKLKNCFFWKSPKMIFFQFVYCTFLWRYLHTLFYCRELPDVYVESVLNSTNTTSKLLKTKRLVTFLCHFYDKCYIIWLVKNKRLKKIITLNDREKRDRPNINNNNSAQKYYSWIFQHTLYSHLNYCKYH